MQDRYFGDVGDFGKYGLLRVLSGLWGGPKFKLGVVWYMFPNENHNADGKHLGYLRKPRDYRDCDEQLYDKLRELLYDDLWRIIEANRNLTIAEKSGLLPEGTIFYGKEQTVSAQFSVQKEWFTDALTKTALADLVFLDPDNGIECKSASRTSKKGPKYVYWEDIDAFVERGQSVVIYHHLGRTGGSHPEQVEDKLRQMRERFGNGFESSAAIFKRGTSRAYFVLASPRHKDLLRQRLSEMVSGPWKRHFSLARNAPVQILLADAKAYVASQAKA
jgi:hypothetical protein